MRRNFFSVASSWMTGVASCALSKWIAVRSASKRSRCEYMSVYSCACGGLGWANSASVSGIRRPGEPAHRPVDHVEERLVREAPRRRGLDPVRQPDRRRPAPRRAALRSTSSRMAANPLRSAPQRPLEVPAVQHGVAHEGEAPALHPPPVEPEELVVELERHREPQGGERVGGHPSVRRPDELRGDAARGEDPGARVVGEPRDRGGDEVHRDGVLFQGFQGARPGSYCGGSPTGKKRQRSRRLRASPRRGARV